MLGKLDDYLRFHQTALSVRAQRQELLASNIANADTPNYKARDIDFRRALQDALAPAAQPAPAAPTMTAARHISGSTLALADSKQAFLQTQHRAAQQDSIDGNTVDMDLQQTQFTDNALRYQAGITLINGQIRSLLTAIQGQ